MTHERRAGNMEIVARIAKFKKRIVSNLLLSCGGLSGGDERLLQLRHTIPTFLQEALLALALPDLHHVVLSLPAGFIGVHSQLVALFANLHASVGTERHCETNGKTPKQTRTGAIRHEKCRGRDLKNGEDRADWESEGPAEAKEVQEMEEEED